MSACSFSHQAASAGPPYDGLLAHLGAEVLWLRQVVGSLAAERALPRCGGASWCWCGTLVFSGGGHAPLACAGGQRGCSSGGGPRAACRGACEWRGHRPSAAVRPAGGGIGCGVEASRARAGVVTGAAAFGTGHPAGKRFRRARVDRCRGRGAGGGISVRFGLWGCHHPACCTSRRAPSRSPCGRPAQVRVQEASSSSQRHGAD